MAKKFRLIRFVIRGDRAVAFIRGDDEKPTKVVLSKEDRDRIMSIVVESIEGDLVGNDEFMEHAKKKKRD